MRSRPGVTLLEQLLVLVISALLLGIAVQRLGAYRDQLSVRSARDDVRDAFALAREHAVSTGRHTAVRFPPGEDRVVVHADTDTLQRASLAARHGVSITASRDSMAYQLSGLGYGGANLSVALQRGTRTDTVFVSRLGRVR